MKDFDSHFNKMQQRSTTIFRVSLITFILSAAVTLAGLAAIVYVAAHFLAKFW